MPWTLQKYIFREMGKTFVLTTIGLMGIMGMGGGVMNMIELEGVSAMQLLKIMGLILPISAALSLPFAALYAATSTYGRMSADNEFTACRSSGINIHILLLPTLVFSLFSAVCSFFFINFVIPGMVMNIDQFIGSDLPRIVSSQLNSPKRLGLNRDMYRIYANQHRMITPTGEEHVGISQLELSGVAFVEVDNQEWVRYGSARRVVIEFDARGESAAIAADMFDLSVYDQKAGRWADQERETIGRYTIPRTIPMKIKWLNLGAILQYRAQPTLIPDVRKDLATLRGGIARWMFYEDIRNQFAGSMQRIKTHGEAVFGDHRIRYTVQAGELSRDAKEGRPIFRKEVTILQHVAGQLYRTIQCESASMQVDRGASDDILVFLQADGRVNITDMRQPDRPIPRDRLRLDSVALPEDFIKQAALVPEEDLLSAAGPSRGFGEWADQKREDLIEELGEYSRDITGVLHSRMAFSLSVFVLVIMGAVLGIVFRGTHTLTAFGISFVPSLFVITMIIMGKQLIDKPNTVDVGVAVAWLGIGLVAAIDLYVMTRVLRR